MVKLVRTLAAENDMNFEDVVYFETLNYVGMWDYGGDDGFLLMPKEDCELRTSKINAVTSYEELDNTVYDDCGEHIIGVSDNCYYKMQVGTTVMPKLDGLVGIVFKYGVNDYSIWQVNLDPNDEAEINAILEKYETEGFNIRGDKWLALSEAGFE